MSAPKITYPELDRLAREASLRVSEQALRSADARAKATASRLTVGRTLAYGFAGTVGVMATQFVALVAGSLGA